MVATSGEWGRKKATADVIDFCNCCVLSWHGLRIACLVKGNGYQYDQRSSHVLIAILCPLFVRIYSHYLFDWLMVNRWYGLSAQRFSPRDAMHKRGMPSCGVCTSARLPCSPVTFLYCVKTSNHILKLFHCSSFSVLNLWQYSNGNPLTEASNAGVSRFIEKMIPDRVIVIMERQ